MLMKTCWTPLSSDNRNVCAKPVLLFVNMVAVATGNLQLLGEKEVGEWGNMSTNFTSANACSSFSAFSRNRLQPFFVCFSNTGTGRVTVRSQVVQYGTYLGAEAPACWTSSHFFQMAQVSVLQPAQALCAHTAS